MVTIEDINYIKKNHPKLHIKYRNNDLYIIGEFEMKARFKNETLEDSFFLEFSIPASYPNDFPKVKSLDEKISTTYHTNPDGCLCLGTEANIYEIFNKERTLKNFMENILIHFLYRFSYIKKNDKEPYRDKSHGIEGVLEYYFEKFETRNKNIVLKILGNYLGLLRFNKKWCYCKSGKKYKNCHFLKINELFELVPKKVLEDDYNRIRKKL